jgi:hypothetical protein
MKVSKTLTLDPDLIVWLNKESVDRDRSMSYSVNLYLRRVMDNQRRNEKEGDNHLATE